MSNLIGASKQSGGALLGLYSYGIRVHLDADLKENFRLAVNKVTT